MSSIIDKANEIISKQDKCEDKDKYAILKTKDGYCEEVADFHEKNDTKNEKVSIMLKVNTELDGYGLMVAYPNGKVLKDFISQDEIDDCLESVRSDEPNEDHEEDDSLMLCTGWRIDAYRDNGYVAEWLNEEE